MKNKWKVEKIYKIKIKFKSRNFYYEIKNLHLQEIVK